MAVINENRRNLTADIISKMISSEGNKMTAAQIKELRDTLQETLSKYDIVEDEERAENIDYQQENAKVLKDFISSKRIEGRSNTTLYNYAREVTKMFITVNKSYRYTTTQDIRDYLSWRKKTSDLRPASLENIRMYLLSFFKWCYIEELIRRNPMDRIGVIKQEQRVVQTLTDEEQEMIICACENERDRAIIDVLSGTGMRVSELVSLDRSDVDFNTGGINSIRKGK